MNKIENTGDYIVCSSQLLLINVRFYSKDFASAKTVKKILRLCYARRATRLSKNYSVCLVKASMTLEVYFDALHQFKR